LFAIFLKNIKKTLAKYIALCYINKGADAAQKNMED
jgi:hypothetical protein